MKQSIAINGRFLTQSITGVQRCALEVVQQIDALLLENPVLCKKYDFTLISPKASRSHAISLKVIKHIITPRIQTQFWEQILLTWYARKSLLLCLCNTGPIIHPNQSVTIHDASFITHPDGYTKWYRFWNVSILRFLVKRVFKIVTDSRYWQIELQSHFKFDASKIQTIYLGHEHITRVNPDYSIHENYDLNAKPYILAVSSKNPNKNFKLITDALSLLKNVDYNVVIAGGGDNNVYVDDGFTYPSFVRCVGFVSDSQLKALYLKSQCFVYPSITEGFGLPPLEAIACGCPIIISDRTCLPEIFGDSALYCNPYDPSDLATKITHLSESEELRKALIAKGRLLLGRYTWRKCGEQYFDIITGR